MFASRGYPTGLTMLSAISIQLNINYPPLYIPTTATHLFQKIIYGAIHAGVLLYGVIVCWDKGLGI